MSEIIGPDIPGDSPQPLSGINRDSQRNYFFPSDKTSYHDDDHERRHLYLAFFQD